MKASTKFCLMLRMVARLKARARAMPARSPLTRVTPALSMATSVPVSIATPTSASASAGASFTPSPAIATAWPSLLRRRTIAFFCSGKTSASMSAMPSLVATACAVVRLSPVNMTIRTPSWQAGERRRCRRFDRIGHRDDAGRLAIDGDKHCGGAFAAKLVSSRFQVSGGDAEILEELGVTHHYVMAAYSAGNALARNRGEVGNILDRQAALFGGSDDCGGKRMLARAF